MRSARGHRWRSRKARTNAGRSTSYTTELLDGRRFHPSLIVDDFTREYLGLVADSPLSGVRVTRLRRASSAGFATSA
jgi:hypothetical protein